LEVRRLLFRISLIRSLWNVNVSLTYDSDVRLIVVGLSFVLGKMKNRRMNMQLITHDQKTRIVVSEVGSFVQILIARTPKRKKGEIQRQPLLASILSSEDQIIVENEHTNEKVSVMWNGPVKKRVYKHKKETRGPNEPRTERARRRVPECVIEELQEKKAITPIIVEEASPEPPDPNPK
jgi:hypothetical protein